MKSPYVLGPGNKVYEQRGDAMHLVCKRKGALMVLPAGVELIPSMAEPATPDDIPQSDEVQS